jgi:hypothetical protein
MDKIKNKIFGIYNTISYYGVSYLLPYKIRQIIHMIKEKIRVFFKPQQKRYRAVIPKTWCDLTELIVIVNLEFIKGFYEDEFTSGWVNWNATPEHKEFSKWLKKAYKYVSQDRPKLEKDIENAYPPFETTNSIFEKKMVDGLVTRVSSKPNLKGEYFKLYGKVDRLEKKLKDLDSKIIKEMVDCREYFWT